MTGDGEEEDLQSKVGKWLEVSGHALEMRVARSFYRSGADVYQSVHYRDGETLREVDVVAEYVGGGPARTSWSLQVVVECKGGTGKPWVVFVRRGSYGQHQVEAEALCYGDSQAGVRELTEDWIAEPPFDYSRLRVGYAIATGELSGKAGDIPNTAYNAVRQVISGCYGLLGPDGVARPVSDGLMLPVVVTKAPIFEASLDDDGTVRATRTPSAVLLVRPDQEERRLAVHVMDEEHLHDVFVPAVQRLYERYRG